MKKKNLKPMIISALLATGFAATSVGTSFALFTDKAETSISVQAGKVEIEDSIVIKSVASLNTTDTDTKIIPNTDNKQASFQNGGSVAITTTGGVKSVEIEKMTPGDKVVLEINEVNKSNVKIKTRFKATHTSTTDPDLFDALSITYQALDKNNNDITYKFMDWNLVDIPAAEQELIAKITVTIEFKDHDNGQILFGDDNHDNEYQNSNCSIVFAQEAVQGNAAVLSLIEEMNNKLASQSVRNNTLTDALADVSTLATVDVVQAMDFAWNSETDRFEYAAEVTSGTENKYFKVYSSMPSTQSYSIYAYGWTTQATVNLNGVGFDAGNSTGINAINYENTTSTAKTSIINSNSYTTTLTIDAENDIVHHYGNLGYLNIIAVAGESYHEYGNVGFAEITKGRIALESTAEVNQIHFDYNETTDKFEDIIVAYDPNIELPKFSRDRVENIKEGGTLVVELQNSTDATEADSSYVWLYQDGLKEQIRVSETKEAAGNVKSTDAGVREEVAEAAAQIANNLVGDKTYEGLVEENQVNGDGSIKSDVVKDLVEESGLSATEKAKVKEEANSKGLDEYVSDLDADYVARIGTTGYETLRDAVEAAQTGEVIKLLKDITITDYYSDGYALNVLYKITLDGGNHKITLGNNTETHYFVNHCVGSTIKNLSVYGMNDSLIYWIFAGSVIENVKTYGNYSADGNCGVFSIYANKLGGLSEQRIIYRNCVNNVKMTGTGTETDYNAAFLGFTVSDNLIVEFDHCVNNAEIRCGKAALFIGNPRGYANRIIINDCENNGLIVRTNTEEGQYVVDQSIFGAVADYQGTIIVDGKEYKYSQNDRSALLALTDYFGNYVRGNGNINISLTRADGGKFLVTPDRDSEDISYYVLSIGLYVGLVGGGSNRYYINQRFDNLKSARVSDLMELSFVDLDWVAAHEGEYINASWDEDVKLYSYQNNLYYVINDPKYESNAIVTPAEMISLSAFNADNVLLASVGLTSND